MVEEMMRPLGDFISVLSSHLCTEAVCDVCVSVFVWCYWLLVKCADVVLMFL